MTRRSKQVMFFIGYVVVLTELLVIIRHSLAMAAQGELAGWWYGSAVLAAIAIVVVAVTRPLLAPPREAREPVRRITRDRI